MKKERKDEHRDQLLEIQNKEKENVVERETQRKKKRRGRKRDNSGLFDQER